MTYIHYKIGLLEYLDIQFFGLSVSALQVSEKPKELKITHTLSTRRYFSNFPSAGLHDFSRLEQAQHPLFHKAAVIFLENREPFHPLPCKE